MNTIQSSILILFVILIYIIAVDKNVEDYLILTLKLWRINIERFLWIIRVHPRNPVTNFLKEREYAKIAKDLEKELTKND